MLMKASPSSKVKNKAENELEFLLIENLVVHR